MKLSSSFICSMMFNGNFKVQFKQSYQKECDINVSGAAKYLPTFRFSADLQCAAQIYINIT